VETTAVRARARRTVSPLRFTQIAAASAVSLYAIILSGAAVRLTGSGLGCDGWPGCEEGSFFPATDHHALIEFSNRAVAIFPLTLTLVAWLAARRTPGLPRWVAWVAAFTFLGTVGQAPLGRVTIVLDLHPLMVMAHFLLALVVLAGGIVVALEGWSALRGRSEPLVPPWLRLVGLVLAAACAVLVVTGAFSTAAGPHPGDAADIDRFWSLLDAVWLHVRATAVFGVSFLVLLAWLARNRHEVGRLLQLALGLLALLLVQMAIGEIQWRNELPWGLVLAHVALAAAIWAWTVGLVAALWRPPAPLAEPRPGRGPRPAAGGR
jgi:cytochrome c oxidase assembly protein subunit 15